MPDKEIVAIEKLVKIYPGGTKAVAGIDCAVHRGEFFGFLGPNGAGKSTTMKILSTLLKKTSGRAVVAGYDVDRDPGGVRKSIGFAMQEVGLDDLSTGWHFLVLQGLLYGLSRKEAESRARDLLKLVGLTDVANRKVGTYSGGMRRRIDLVAALMHRPPVLFLDEPTTGLDPQSRLAIWEHLSQINKAGTTILLTTQMMEEAEHLCQRIAIIDLGQIIVEGSPEGLKAQVGGDVVHLTVRPTESVRAGSGVEIAQSLVRERSYVAEVQRSDSTLSVQVANGATALPDLLQLLQEGGIFVSALSIQNPTLEDVFLQYTGRKIRTEGASGDEVAQALRPMLGLRRN